MKLIELQKNNNWIYGIRILDHFIDFRKWYQIYIPENERDALDMTNKRGWSCTWFCEEELDEVLLEEPHIKYRRVNFLFSNVHIDDIYHSLKAIIWFLTGIGTMYLIFRIMKILSTTQH